MSADEFERVAVRRIIDVEVLGPGAERRTLDCGHRVDRLPVRVDDDGQALPADTTDLCGPCIQAARSASTPQCSHPADERCLDCATDAEVLDAVPTWSAS